MKRIKILAIILLFTFALSSCVELSSVESIELNWTPTTQYTQNDEVLLDDKIVTVNFAGGVTQDFTIENSAILKESGIYQSGGNYFLDTRETGTFTFRISYEGSLFSVQYTVASEEPELDVDDLNGLIDVMAGTSPVTITITTDITLDRNLSTTRLLSIIVADGATLDLTGYSLTIDVSGQEIGAFEENMFTMSGNFVGGSILASSVFNNSPQQSHLFDVTGTTAFDVVYLESGDRDDIQNLIDDASTTTILLGANQFDILTTLNLDSTDKPIRIIGKTNSFDEPTTVFMGKPDLTYVGVSITGSNNVSIHNVHFTMFSHYQGHAPGSSTIRTNSPFTSDALFDNIVITYFGREAIRAVDGVTVTIKNSIVDGAFEEGLSQTLQNAVMITNGVEAYMINNLFTNIATNDTGWGSATVSLWYGATLAALIDNTFINNDDYAFVMANYYDPSGTVFNLMSTGSISGNVFLNNGYNIAGDTYIGDWQYSFTVSGHGGTIDDAFVAHATYLEFDFYEDGNSWNGVSITNTNSTEQQRTVTQSVTVDDLTIIVGGSDLVNQGTLLIDEGVTLTLGENSQLYVNHDSSSSINDVSRLVYAAYYTSDDNETVYVGSLDLIPEGTDYTLYGN
jgi:hypothetical protein